MPCTNNNNWMNGREMSKNMSTKRTFAETQRNPMVCADRRSPLRRIGKEKWQQRRRQRRLKNDFTCIIQPTNLDAFSLSTTVRNIPNRICETASKFEKKFLKLVKVLEYAECGHFALLFCKEWQWNEQNYNPRLHSRSTRCRCLLVTWVKTFHIGNLLSYLGNFLVICKM